MRFFLAGFLALALVSCGGGSECQKFSGLCYAPVDGARLVISPSGMSGPGGVRFSAMTVPNYHVGAKFSVEDGGSVTIVFNGDTSLQNGVPVQFVRKGNRLDPVKVQGATMDGATPFKDYFAGVNAANPIELEFDFHGPGHNHIFVDGVGLARTAELDMVGTTGSGRFWGVILDKATLLGVSNTDVLRYPGR